MDNYRFVQQRPQVTYGFPGQGSQHVGMAQELAQTFPVAQAAFAEADEVLGFALSTLCFEGPEELLTDTVNAQPALMAASVATLRVLASELDNGDADAAGSEVFIAGHSMGEYTALVAAGSLAFADGLRLVRERGRLMKEAGAKAPGAMAAALGLDETQVAEVCAEVAATGGIVQVANDNCPGQVVISGDREGMEQAIAALEKAGARKVTRLAVSIAAHSPLMAPAADELRAAIQSTPLSDPVVPVIGNTTAEPLTRVEEIRQELVDQLTGSVRWTASMRRAMAGGATSFVEIGPGDVLTKLMRRIDRKSDRHTVGDPASVEAFVKWYSNR